MKWIKRAIGLVALIMAIAVGIWVGRKIAALRDQPAIEAARNTFNFLFRRRDGRTDKELTLIRRQNERILRQTDKIVSQNARILADLAA